MSFTTENGTLLAKLAKIAMACRSGFRISRSAFPSSELSRISMPQHGKLTASDSIEDQLTTM